MITYGENEVCFDIDEEDLIKSIATFEIMKDFYSKNSNTTSDAIQSALACAIETMQAFYCEHFGGEK